MLTILTALHLLVAAPLPAALVPMVPAIPVRSTEPRDNRAARRKAGKGER